MTSSKFSTVARRRVVASLAGVCAGFGSVSAQPLDKGIAKAEVHRGRYLAMVAGCNDCHTPGYAEKAGQVDEKLWLTGTALGWRGPWGTTYPANLRLVAQGLSQAQWLKHARSEWRPPMPWFALRDMSDRDVASIYAYLRHLGPGGAPAPAYVAPDKTPPAPFVSFP